MEILYNKSCILTAMQSLGIRYMGTGGYTDNDNFTPLLKKPLMKVLAFGDSFTDNGDTVRAVNGRYIILTAGYWGCAWALSSQEFEMLDGKGVTGNTTLDLSNRISDATSSDADVIFLLCGTNDLSAGRTPEQTRDEMADILDQIIASGKKVLLVPVAYRRDVDGLNPSIAALNSYYQELALQRKGNVVMANSSTLFDNLSAADSREATTDGLHPTAYGSILIAQEVVKTFDKFFISEDVERINYVPNPGFNGVSGTLFNGATGNVPDAWRTFYADPANDGVGTGLGSTVNGDGSVTLSTGNNTGISNGTSVLFTTGDTTVPQGGRWRFELEVDCENFGSSTEYKIYLTSNDVNVGIVEFQTFRITGDLKFNKFKMKTPYVDIKDATKIKVHFKVVTSGGGVVTSTIRNPKLLKEGS